MGSASEAKKGSTYINNKYDLPFITCLIDMGHPQPPKNLQIDNTTAEEFSKGKQKIIRKP